MPLLFRKRSEPDRSTLLSAIPLRNELVCSTSNGDGLRLTAPLKPSVFRRIFAVRSAAIAEKSFDLDDLGKWLWHRLDGKNSVEFLIRQFAADHRVNLREAEVSVVAFLRTLTQRNLIAFSSE